MKIGGSETTIMTEAAKLHEEFNLRLARASIRALQFAPEKFWAPSVAYLLGDHAGRVVAERVNGKGHFGHDGFKTDFRVDPISVLPDWYENLTAEDDSIAHRYVDAKRCETPEATVFQYAVVGMIGWPKDSYLRWMDDQFLVERVRKYLPDEGIMPDECVAFSVHPFRYIRQLVDDQFEAPNVLDFGMCFYNLNQQGMAFFDRDYHAMVDDWGELE